MGLGLLTGMGLIPGTQILPSKIIVIPDGPEGTKKTLELMGQIVRQFRKSPFIRQLATSLVQPLPNKDWIGEMSVLLNYVRNNIRYTQDINEIELLQTPMATLHLRHGDCDDMCILLSSLCEAIGFQTRFVAIGFEPQTFVHVYLQIFEPDNAEWISADPTEPNSLGWNASGECCRMVQQI